MILLKANYCFNVSSTLDAVHTFQLEMRYFSFLQTFIYQYMLLKFDNMNCSKLCILFSSIIPICLSPFSRCMVITT